MEAWGPALKNLQRIRAFPQNPGGVPPPLAVWTPAWEGAWTAVPFCDLGLCRFLNTQVGLPVCCGGCWGQDQSASSLSAQFAESKFR